MTPAELESEAAKEQAAAVEDWQAAKLAIILAETALHQAKVAERSALHQLIRANEKLMDATLQVTSQQEAQT